MVVGKLRKYIDAQIKKGVSTADIRSVLKKEGYSQDLISSSWPHKTSKPDFLSWALGIMLVIVVVVAVQSDFMKDEVSIPLVEEVEDIVENIPVEYMGEWTDMDYLLASSFETNISYCDIINDSNYRLACEGIIEIDVTKCKDVTILEPQYECLLALENKIGDPVRDYHYLDMAYWEIDMDYCDMIETKDIKKACLGIMKNDIVLCNEVGDQASREFCLSVVIQEN